MDSAWTSDFVMGIEVEMFCLEALQFLLFSLNNNMYCNSSNFKNRNPTYTPFRMDGIVLAWTSDFVMATEI